MYVRDCWKAVRTVEMDLMGVAVRAVKKVFAGLLWKARAGRDLKADFDAAGTAVASLKGVLAANAIFAD